MKDLLGHVEAARIEGNDSVGISALTLDSRQAAGGTLFFAVRGEKSDGHDYIDKAVEAGASTVVCERMPERLADGVTYVQVADSHAAVGQIASAFYGHPSEKLKLVGVTGTNGKTTTATLLYDMFRGLGYEAGLISTVVYRIGARRVDSTHTTPDAIRLNAMLAEMVDEGCDYCFIEVSSHSVVQRRIEGLTFAGGVFTNLTHDHLDYHKTFADYLKAKKGFFDGLHKDSFALVNADDKNGMVMVQNTKAAVKTYSLRSMADFKCRVVEMHVDGMLLNIDSEEVWVKFLGRFNAYNLLAVYATAVLLGSDRREALQQLSALVPVDGRFEYLRSDDGITAVVDYAHTPDALQNVINTVNEILQPEQKLFVVVGCGGDRDAAKRPVMAKIAASQCDLAILTSDNPRTENPDEIIAQMKAGLDRGDRYLAITDRREAIRAAVMMASKGDVVLVAGKGHETYQEINGVRNHFDDRVEVRAAFENR